MKEKEKERRYEEAIEALTRRPAIKFEDKNPSHKIKETYWRHDTGVPKQHKKYTRFAKKLSTLAVIVIIGVVFFYFMKTGQLSTTLSSAQSLLENTTQNVVSSVDEQISRLPIRREIDVAKVETEIHNLINSQRQRYGLSPLSYDARLASIARAHSEDMVRRNFFDHVNPDGKDPTSRGIAASYSCYKDYGSYYTTGLAENLNQIPTGDVIGCGYVYTEEEITQCAVDGWMESLGHRQNILTATYDKEGIGVALSSGNVAYITQDFC
ncbi:MAG: CAP domain-containing protein [Candidatus Aenigmarchaeota archaeon]|nr:CAP domain-containing protein [Candidatus Aenigmarchaeota archaeon]